MDYIEGYLRAGIVIGVIFLIIWILVNGTAKLINYYESKPKVILVGTGYYIYRRRNGGQFYNTLDHDWWYHSLYATRFTSEENARANFPPKPLGYFGKRRKKKEEQRVLREREERLKAHKEKMLKVRLDFSDYG